MNILIVDDNATNRRLLRAQLEAEGEAVVEAGDGLEALHLAARESVGAIISDILMPRMDGYRLCREVRQHESLRALPFILYTSTYNSASDRRLAQSVGADGFILKPAPTSVLIEALREAVRKSESRPPVLAAPPEAQVLQQYNQVLVTKLEDKNTQLQAALSELQRSHEHILRLNRELERRVQERTAELAHANAELGRAARLKDEFLANMSHELRTPLNAILGLSEALLEQTAGGLTARQIKAITTISHSGHHLLALINDILDLSKIEAGRMELQPEAVGCDALCEGCLDFIRSQAIRKGIAVEFETDSPGAALEADPRRLKQILVNLLTNAVKFTPEHGRVGLAVRAAAGAGSVQFTVWDTGIGIAASQRTKLFQPFTQIDSGLTRAQEGTGLGLALVARLVDLHRGSVALESEPEKGSRFTVTLPQSAVPTPVRANSAAATDRRDIRRALLIEDDPTSAALLAGRLEELGVATVSRPLTEDPVAVVVREHPDLIVLDILLPDESGWTVLSRLKDSPATHDIPVAVISVVDEPEKSRALGAVAHFTKPVTREQLAAFLQRPTGRVPLPAPRCDAVPVPSGPSILLAEDNAANVETMGGYLEDRGYAMTYATNGLVAVKVAREQRPALILMDVQMPVMDGLAAISALRADPALRATPIIALTALAMPGDRERCLAAGANEYLTKPVSLKALAELVARLLPGGDDGLGTKDQGQGTRDQGPGNKDHEP